MGGRVRFTFFNLALNNVPTKTLRKIPRNHRVPLSLLTPCHGSDRVTTAQSWRYTANFMTEFDRQCF